MASSPGTVTATTIINLAITRSGDGEGRILIVELVSGPQTASAALGVPHQPGFREVLARTAPLTLALNLADEPLSVPGEVVESSGGTPVEPHGWAVTGA